MTAWQSSWKIHDKNKRTAVNSPHVKSKTKLEISIWSKLHLIKIPQQAISTSISPFRLLPIFNDLGLGQRHTHYCKLLWICISCSHGIVHIASNFHSTHKGIIQDVILTKLIRCSYLYQLLPCPSLFCHQISVKTLKRQQYSNRSWSHDISINNINLLLSHLLFRVTPSFSS